MCHGKLEHADGQYFRFKDPTVAQVHALRVGVIGQTDDDGAAPTEAESEIAERLGLKPGVSEVLYNFGNHWEVGIFVRVIVHALAAATAEVAFGAEGIQFLPATKDSKETPSALKEKTPEFRFSFKGGSFKRNLTEAEAKASLIEPPQVPLPVPPWPRSSDSAAK